MIPPKLSPLGERIWEELLNIRKFHPKLAILRFVIMPDHIHFLLQVKERLDRVVGKELAGFLGACSKHFRDFHGEEKLKKLFLPFHDSIIMNKEQFKRAYAYIGDNPRRAIIKGRYPTLFKRRLHLSIGTQEFGAYGNIFLLRKPYLLPVRIHRRWSSEEMNNYMESCRKEIWKGAIPISPAIHPVEKGIMREATKNGSPIIRIVSYHFSERYKPSGVDFDLCASGKLLLLAPWQEEGGKKQSGYREFHNMNDMAKMIASLPAGTRMQIEGTSPKQ